MDKSTLRPWVLEILRRMPQTHLHAIEAEIRKLTDDYERHDALVLQEILWEFLVQGVLAPGKNSLNLNLPFVHLTDFGSEALEGGDICAHDPEGYVNRLRASCGEGVDPDLVETAREALLAFLAGRYPSSAVVLARAAAILLHRLGLSLIEHGKRVGRGVKRLEAARSDPSRLVAVIRRTLPSGRSLPELEEDAEAHLRGLETLLDAACPSGERLRLPRTDRETALAHLLLFPSHARFVHHLIEHLERGSRA